MPLARGKLRVLPALMAFAALVSGGAASAVPPRSVLLQRRVRGRWRTAARARVRRDSTFAAGHAFTTPGLEQWRALISATTRNLGSTSAPVSIRVAPATGIHKIRHVVIIMQENRS